VTVQLHLSHPLSREQREHQQGPRVRADDDLLAVVADGVTVYVAPLVGTDLQLSPGNAPQAEGLVVGEQHTFGVAGYEEVAGRSGNAHDLGDLRAIRGIVEADCVISEVDDGIAFALGNPSASGVGGASNDCPDVLMVQVQDLYCLVSDYESETHAVAHVQLLHSGSE
jgi:hypothetical protein